MPVDSLRHFTRESLAMEVIENQVETIKYLIDLCVENKINIRKTVPLIKDTQRLFEEMGLLKVYEEAEKEE